jgi:hypothetical protein
VSWDQGALGEAILEMVVERRNELRFAEGLSRQRTEKPAAPPRRNRPPPCPEVGLEMSKLTKGKQFYDAECAHLLFPLPNGLVPWQMYCDCWQSILTRTAGYAYRVVRESEGTVTLNRSTQLLIHIGYGT